MYICIYIYIHLYTCLACIRPMTHANWDDFIYVCMYMYTCMYVHLHNMYNMYIYIHTDECIKYV